MSRELVRSTTSVGSMTFLSRILGFIRDIVLAYTFGASASYDAFILAFKIPNFLRRLFAEGAFSQAFVPVLAEYKIQKSSSITKVFLDKVFGSLLIILIIISLIGSISSPVIVKIFAPGFANNSEQCLLAVELLRITFPYILLISSASLFAAILNSYNHFAIPAFTPVFLNIAFIGGALLFTDSFSKPIEVLAWAVIVGGILQCLFQLPALAKINKLPIPRVDFYHPGVSKILRLMLPIIFGVAVNQINILIDTIFASFLPIGSLSWLYYSDRLMELPLGVFGVALATVILPKLSQHYSRNSKGDFLETINWSIKIICFIGMPCSVGLYILAEPILSTLFLGGAFTSLDVHMASLSLKAYSIGILGLMLSKVLTASFYAQRDVKTPVKIALITLVSNVILNFILIKFLAHAGLAMATSLAAIINAILLAKGLHNKNLLQIYKTYKFFGKVILSSLIMGLVLYFILPEPSKWYNWLIVAKVRNLLMFIGYGIIIFFLTMLSLGIRPRHLISKTV